MLCYENRNLNPEDKTQKVKAILKAFNSVDNQENEDIEFEEEKSEEVSQSKDSPIKGEESSGDDIQGFLWHSQDIQMISMMRNLSLWIKGKQMSLG